MASLQRRSSRFFPLPLGFSVVLIVGSAAAQTYPAQPVALITGFGPGGEVYRTAYLIGQVLTERLGQPFNVESRVGDRTNIATEAVVRAPADGYTLLVANVANAINATLYDKLNFNFIRDIAPIAGVVRISPIIVVNPSFAPRTVPELIAYARGNPGKVAVAVPAPPVLVVAAAWFRMRSGLDLAHVPYAGDGPAIKALLAGEVPMQFAGLGAAKEHIASGKLRALAVTAATRARALDVPTVGESLPGYEVNSWLGIGAPRNTPMEIVERLAREITSAVSDSNVQARILDSGHEPMPMTRAAFEKFVADETEKFGKLVKLTGIKSQ